MLFTAAASIDNHVVVVDRNNKDRGTVGHLYCSSEPLVRCRDY